MTKKFLKFNCFVTNRLPRYNATDDDIKRAYRQIVLKHHPDKRKAQGEEIKTEDDYFTCITRAYEILGMYLSVCDILVTSFDTHFHRMKNRCETNINTGIPQGRSNDRAIYNHKKKIKWTFFQCRESNKTSLLRQCRSRVWWFTANNERN